MFKQERYNKENQLISYRLICSGKDPNNGKHKNYTKTWKIPKYLNGKKEIEKELKKVEIAFEEEVEKISQGIRAIEQNKMFKDYAESFLQEKIDQKPDSYTYHKRIKDNLDIIIPYFEKFSIKNISPSIIQNFYNYISSRQKESQVIKVKQSINELLEEKGLSKSKLADDTGLNRLTIRIASKVGQTINKSTAEAISNYFNVPINKYFDIQKTISKYSSETNQSIKRTLVGIFAKAKRELIIDHNFATNDYTELSVQHAKKREIYTLEEAKEFIKYLNDSPIKIKTILSLLMYLGLRRCEIAGLSLFDLDFDKRTITINNNNIYIPRIGVIEKSTKTENSERILPMIGPIYNVLQEYMKWYNEEKIKHGDKWQQSNKLFLQDCGLPINPTSISQWVNKFQIKHGLKHVCTHGLRHTAITLLISLGVSPKVVSKIAGHSNESITLKIYTHVFGHDFEEAIDLYTKELIS